MVPVISSAILTANDTSVKIESMNTELTIEQRAARHAALAEPARLQMVDLLTLGDWSPSELQSRVGLLSNLLAHHLNVLETAGLITRGRSEADRRRSYVRLDPAALTEPAVGQIRARRVLFVCAPRTRPDRSWRLRCGIERARSRRHPAEPTRQIRSTRALSRPRASMA
ncbi:MAG: helix-turn-helix domain-containing protein [Schumannella sp.]